MIYTFYLECTTNLAYETDDDTPAQTNENYYCGSVNMISIEPSDEEIVDKEKKVKKRHKKPFKWTRNIAKNNRAKGVSYISLTGKLREERKTGLPCKCKNARFTKVCEEDRKTIIDIFNQIACKEKQDTHLCGLMKLKEIVRKRPRTGTKTTKTFVSKFTVLIGMTEFIVCKKAFCSLHGISLSRVDRLQVCIKSNNHSPKDRRGKHENRPNIIPDTIINQINEQICPSRESNSNVTYLSPDLNLKIMHNLYLDKYETEIYNQHKNGEEVHPKVKYDFFTCHFADNFNISFGFPRTDTCQTCDHLKMVIDAQIEVDQKLVLQSEKDLHVAKAELFYKDLKKYIEEAKILDKKIEVLCFDYQQNLPLPHVPAGDVFYKRQLWVYKFCMYSGKTGKSYFYMYDEVTAKKGKNEVISFLNHFFSTILDRQVDTVYLFSDNCSTQNKNHSPTFIRCNKKSNKSNKNLTSFRRIG